MDHKSIDTASDVTDPAKNSHPLDADLSRDQN